jgi:GMC oxidoreductase
MNRVRYTTTAFRSPQRVTCRVEAAQRPWPEFAGTYVDGLWLFDLPDNVGGEAVLVLDGQREGARFAVRPLVELDDAAAGLRTQPIAVDDGRLQRTWFAEGADATKRWDVIVVGTGMGGGTLLTSLARNPTTVRDPGRRLDVLGLEAGSLLFTGHAGNQPAVRPAGDAQFPITMWNTLPDFGTRPFAQPDWGGYELFALGGRSLYWGALCPRIDPAELKDHWPAAVAADLDADSAYYLAAEQLFEVSRPRADDVARSGLRVLDELLPRRANGVAPIALRREKPTSWRIPGGLFSTAELLLEERLSRNFNGYGPPYVHLGEIVVGVEPDELGWVLHTVDLRDGGPKVRYTRKVVLCCGTVESARVLAAPPLALPKVTAGVMLTEHLMGWVHFEIPPGNPFCRADTSAKLLSTPGTSGADWNLVLDLGSDLNLGFADAADWARSATSPGAVAAQMVILGRASRDQGAALRFGPDPWLDLNLPGGGLPAATLAARNAGGIPDTWNGVARRVMAALGAEVLAGERDDQNNKGWPNLRPGGWGYVAHEIGTLPMSGNGTGVVNTDLEVEGTPAGGLYVCDNSVFPSSPAANPSLTLAGLALRLADHLRGLRW